MKQRQRREAKLRFLKKVVTISFVIVVLLRARSGTILQGKHQPDSNSSGGNKSGERNNQKKEELREPVGWPQHYDRHKHDQDDAVRKTHGDLSNSTPAAVQENSPRQGHVLGAFPATSHKERFGDKTNRTLEFIHITKTGGTSIEKLAFQNGIRWGRCHFSRGFGCGEADWRHQGYAKRISVQGGSSNSINGLKLVAVYWHMPQHWITPQNPNHSVFREGVDTFVVVRNPYDRWISEYYCDYFGYKGDDKDTEEALNRWIADNITNAVNQYDHTLPQHYYVFNERAERVVTHVLYYETLKVQFDRLMDQYGLPMRLPPKEASGRKKMTRFNLTAATVRLINLQAAQDFTAFKYPYMLSPKAA